MLLIKKGSKKTSLRLPLQITGILFLAPTVEPLKVKVSNANSTSLNVTWIAPPPSETHGKIRQYSIRYRKVNCKTTSSDLGAWTYVHTNETLRFTTITGLAKWSCYAVQVCAVTIKNGKWSTEIQRRTSEDGKIIYIL